jgi:DNA processing protein
MCHGNHGVTQPHIAKVYSLSPLKTAVSILEKTGTSDIGLTHYWDESYPPALRRIKNPPLVLYYRGSLPVGRSVAVVGTRAPLETSRQTVREIVRALVSAGFTVVSGMARGIDGESHQAALKEGGKTAGVLANGIDIVYPLANSGLYYKIIETHGSSLISEYPPGIRAGKWTFRKRNRIISGLSEATVVVQAGRKSGTLITAGYAAEQGRDVFVCPGQAFDSDFYGSHRLIEEGARILYDLDTFIMDLTGHAPEMQLPLFRETQEDVTSYRTFPAEDTREGQIIRYLSEKAADIDTVIRDCNIPAHEFQEVLVLLEMEGLVIRKGNLLSVARF